MPNQQKSWNRVYYAKKKLSILYFEAAVATNSPNNKAVVTTDSATADFAVINGLSILAGIAAAADSWLVIANGIVRRALARQMAKSRYVKPAIDNIIHARSIEAQAVVLLAVADHSFLAIACELARISLSKDQTAQIFGCKQSA
jgi:ribosomal 50S subunit-recycling heat shock protein